MSITGILLMSVLITAPGTVPGAAPGSERPVEIRGEHVQALQAACEAFREKLPEAQLKHYDVEIGTEDGALMVTFVPRVADGEARTLGGSTSLGREMSVWVSPTDYSVQRTAFAR